MSTDKHHSEELIRYLNGQMSPEEAHAFERMALDDPFLSEAIEGAESIGASEFAQDVSSLNEQIQGTQKTPSGFLWKIAASIALLATVGISVWFVTKDIQPNELVDKATPTETIKVDSVETATKADVRIETDSIFEQPVAMTEPEREEIIDVKAKESIAANDGSDAAYKMDEETLAESEAAETEVLIIDADEELAEVAFNITPVPVEAVPAAAKPSAMEEAVPGVEVAESKSKKEISHARSYFQTRMAASGAVQRATPARSVSGTVYDEFGSELPGVSVLKVGTTDGAVTDVEGKFIINDINDSTQLEFNSIGMVTQQVTVGNRSEITIDMTSDNQTLQEVVVVGYGTFNNEPKGYINPAPVSGYEEFEKYLEENLIYPEEAIGNEIDGRVILQLNISVIGEITDIEVKKSLGYGCDEEAIRLIKEGPRWNAATRDGVNVESTVRVRVKFEMK